ncbi:MAG: hypothetical protein NTY07_01510 [Bacteroidia bacterium]|nr:hypothetical protein [Bacteroidia bacterium]
MVFSNREGVRRLRLCLLITGICWLLTMLVLIFVEMFTVLAILAGLFLVVAIVIASLNFQYVRIMVEKNKLIVRYYSIFSVDRMFQMFEFRVDQFRNVEVYKNMFGLKWDIVFTIRVQKGLADYPRISFSAIPFRERSKLVEELRKMIPQKK